jgi:Raf kinase inhibitor-like YbhB/YbcL family protein
VTIRNRYVILTLGLSLMEMTRGDVAQEKSVAKETNMSEFNISSTAFKHGEPIPAEYTCTGDDISPALTWTGAPKGTQSFALICDDPDAPAGPWVHWVLYCIPAKIHAVPENVPKTDIVGVLHGAKQGINDFRKVGYGGPCPPQGHGVHHYHFKLYALDIMPNLHADASKRKLEEAMQGHILAQTVLIGTFERR